MMANATAAPSIHGNLPLENTGFFLSFLLSLYAVVWHSWKRKDLGKMWNHVMFWICTTFAIVSLQRFVFGIVSVAADDRLEEPYCAISFALEQFLASSFMWLYFWFFMIVTLPTLFGPYHGGGHVGTTRRLAVYYGTTVVINASIVAAAFLKRYAFGIPDVWINRSWWCWFAPEEVAFRVIAQSPLYFAFPASVAWLVCVIRSEAHQRRWPVMMFIIGTVLVAFAPVVFIVTIKIFLSESDFYHRLTQFESVYIAFQPFLCVALFIVSELLLPKRLAMLITCSKMRNHSEGRGFASSDDPSTRTSLAYFPPPKDDGLRTQDLLLGEGVRNSEELMYQKHTLTQYVIRVCGAFFQGEDVHIGDHTRQFVYSQAQSRHNSSAYFGATETTFRSSAMSEGVVEGGVNTSRMDSARRDESILGGDHHRRKMLGMAEEDDDNASEVHHDAITSLVFSDPWHTAPDSRRHLESPGPSPGNSQRHLRSSDAKTSTVASSRSTAVYHMSGRDPNFQ